MPQIVSIQLESSISKENLHFEFQNHIKGFNEESQ